MPVPILMYHAVDEQPSLLSTTPDTFARQMAWLQANHFRVISFGDLIQSLRRKAAIEPHTIVLTFDDGFESVYRNAFPVLEQYGFPATVFLVSDMVGKRNRWPGQPEGLPEYPLMTWEHAREMSRRGFEFGSHTRTHPRLDRLDASEALEELARSRTELEDCLGAQVETLSYPYGRFNHQVRQMAEQVYQGACKTGLGLTQEGSDLYALERVDIYYLQRLALFHGLASPWLPAYLAWRKALHSAGSMILRRTWQ